MLAAGASKYGYQVFGSRYFPTLNNPNIETKKHKNKTNPSHISTQLGRLID